jgi:hypothetical protein
VDAKDPSFMRAAIEHAPAVIAKQD